MPSNALPPVRESPRRISTAERLNMLDGEDQSGQHEPTPIRIRKSGIDALRLIPLLLQFEDTVELPVPFWLNPQHQFPKQKVKCKRANASIAVVPLVSALD